MQCSPPREERLLRHYYLIFKVQPPVFFFFYFKKEHGVPSSLAGKSIDLIKEDDGGSDGPRLPKHLQPASATIEQRRRREEGKGGGCTGQILKQER